MKISYLIPFLEEHKSEIKVHCATGSQDVFAPKYAFLAGRFKEWQEDQTQKNFERKYILSLIYWGKNEWLFGGIYESLGFEEDKTKERFIYNTKITNIAEEFIGKLIIAFNKDFRASYLCLENHIEKFELSEIKKELTKMEFPGYDNVNVSWKELSDLITSDSWKTALQNQKGVYLITDCNTGKRYVGSAYGDNMILGRWENYVANGHGGNTELKKLDFTYIRENFRYTILDIFKSTIDDSTIINRESWWKKTLLTRDERFGYNDN